MRRDAKGTRKGGGKRPDEVGREAEARALVHLRRNGLRLLVRNYHCRAGEVDLIMTDGDTVVFVEVRYRRRSDYGGAAASVDRRKQRRLLAAAAHYLGRGRRAAPPCRFDVVALEGDPATGTVQWIVDAFRAD
ncbi:MAG TPA: YraN family protein [Gammaproteobacteria bacterium]|nr:YraN family protein [Gammaproteobacteria bacterium]